MCFLFLIEIQCTSIRKLSLKIYRHKQKVKHYCCPKIQPSRLHRFKIPPFFINKNTPSPKHNTLDGHILRSFLLIWSNILYYTPHILKTKQSKWNFLWKSTKDTSSLEINKGFEIIFVNSWNINKPVYIGLQDILSVLFWRVIP